MADILGLVLIIGTELVKAVRFAAQNRILQKKVYLDEATGLPNKNKCEEILNAQIRSRQMNWLRCAYLT